MGDHRFVSPGQNQPEVQIPQLPLLGPQDFDQLIQDIHEAIEDEATAAEFYGRLLEDAPDDLHRRFIRHAYDDELEHLATFEELYQYFTGMEAVYRITPVQYDTYDEGLILALEDELEAAEFYRDIMLSSTDQLVRDTFHWAMVDELEHATRFSFLYHTLA